MPYNGFILELFVDIFDILFSDCCYSYFHVSANCHVLHRASGHIQMRRRQYLLDDICIILASAQSPKSREALTQGSAISGTDESLYNARSSQGLLDFLRTTDWSNIFSILRAVSLFRIFLYLY